MLLHENLIQPRFEPDFEPTCPVHRLQGHPECHCQSHWDKQPRTLQLASSHQNLVDQPIRIATPYAPNFGLDLTLLRITPELSKLLGQAVRVEHHPVAPGQVALAAVAAHAAASEPAPEARTSAFALRAVQPRPASTQISS